MGQNEKMDDEGLSGGLEGGAARLGHEGGGADGDGQKRGNADEEVDARRRLCEGSHNERHEWERKKEKEAVRDITHTQLVTCARLVAVVLVATG
jgi:hypothetical protein